MKEEMELLLVNLGGMLPVGNKCNPVTEDEMLSIEASIGNSMPSVYREFVMTFGACTFGKEAKVRLNEPMSLYSSSEYRQTAIIYEEIYVAIFYGSARDAASLARYIRLLSGRMPSSLIPIGDDGGGNQICIGVSGGEFGIVYYWDHNNEWDEQDYVDDFGVSMPPKMKFQNVYCVASSFEEFVARLEV